MKDDFLIICRGGGDLATGIVHRLFRSGFKTLILETQKPAAIRRQVSFSEAVYDGTASVEGITAVKIDDINDIDAVFADHKIPLLIDPEGTSIDILKPDVVIDAIIAKRNLGTRINMAPLTIGVGPGFTAGYDVHIVVESMRGHNLGRLITEGAALSNTGTPGNIGGYAAERVIHAEAEGYIKNICKIGDVVDKEQEIARIYSDPEFSGNYTVVKATIPGIIRGLIRNGYYFPKGFKIADIDPRIGELKNCFTISDKSRSIGGSVLEAVCAFANGETIQ